MATLACLIKSVGPPPKNVDTDFVLHFFHLPVLDLNLQHGTRHVANVNTPAFGNQLLSFSRLGGWYLSGTWHVRVDLIRLERHDGLVGACSAHKKKPQIGCFLDVVSMCTGLAELSQLSGAQTHEHKHKHEDEDEHTQQRAVERGLPTRGGKFVDDLAVDPLARGAVEGGVRERGRRTRGLAALERLGRTYRHSSMDYNS